MNLEKDKTKDGPFSVEGVLISAAGSLESHINDAETEMSTHLAENNLSTSKPEGLKIRKALNTFFDNVRKSAGLEEKWLPQDKE